MENTKQQEIEFVYGNATLNVKKIFKICILGESNVGKTCVLRRFSEDAFSDDTKNTIGVDFKIMTIRSNSSIFKLQIWDTAGQERFRAITNTYIKGCDGYILVYDANNPLSFESMDYWVNEVNKNCDKNATKAIIGNKCDLIKKVTLEECEKKFGTESFAFFETSAKEDVNIKQLFALMVKKILEINMTIKEDENGKRYSMQSSNLISLKKNNCAC